MEATVFAAYETTITTSILEEVVNNYSISSGSSITIDNEGQNKQYPKLEITSDNSQITEVEIGGNTVQFDKTITTGDTLILDFKEQEYTLNGTNIVEDITFVSSDLPVLPINTITTTNIVFTNTISVDITYNNYTTLMTNAFVQDFRISIDRGFAEDVKFKKNNRDRLVQNSENFNISFSNLAYDWKLYDALENDVPIRITYNENHTNGTKEYTKHLLGIKFNTYERFFRDKTGIIFESLVGEGTKLI